MRTIPNVVEIVVRAVNQTASGYSAAAKDASAGGEKAGKAFGSALNRTMTVGAAAFAGLVGVAISQGVKLQRSTELLTAAERSKGMVTAANQQILARAINTGHEYGVTQDKVQDAIRKFIGLGMNFKQANETATVAMKIAAVTGQDYTSVLNKLSMGGGTAARFMKQLGIAQVTGKDSATALANAQALLKDRLKQAGDFGNFAAQRHLSLAEASRLVFQASKGNIEAFNKLGIEVLPKTNTAAQNLAQATTILGMKFGVSGDIAAKSFTGQLNALKATAQDTAANLGTRLIPALMNMMGFISRNASLIGPLVVGLTGLMALGKVVNTIYGMAKAFGALNVAMKANPIGLVVTAIALLAAAFYLAWQKSAGFRDAMKNIGNVMLEVAQVVVKVGKFIVDTWMSIAGGILHAAAVAFGWVPGLGSKLKAADKAFQGMREGVDRSFDGMISKMEEWQHKLSDSTNQTERSSQRIVDSFNDAERAAGQAREDINKYTDSIRINGISSDAARGQRQRLIDDMKKAGVNSDIAKRDVDGYTTAVRVNGRDSDAARGARQRMINDIINAWKNSERGKEDMIKYTAAVQSHGKNSDAARGARLRLIQDLERSGVDSRTARSLVDQLTTSIHKIPSRTSAQITMTGSGTYSVRMTSSTNPYPGGISGRAQKGMRIPGYGGGDSRLIAVEPGEVVLPKEASNDPGTVDVAKRYGVPGYAGGGRIGGLSVSWPWDTYSKFAGQFKDAMVRSMKDAINKASEVMGSFVPNVGSGIARWEGVVRQALAMLGLSQYLVLRVLYQMQTESGGNPNAINLWDSNAARGDPSRGLMQVIGSTFRAYHVNGTSWNIYDPLANVAAALNYARARYGPNLMSNGMGIGSGHGYAAGGIASGWAMVGEYGRELVRFPAGSRVYPHGQSEAMMSAIPGWGRLVLEVQSGGHSDFDNFMVSWIRKHVVIKGGGNVQRAFGRH